MLSYQIDQHDTIRWVSETWAEFAQLNGAPLLASSVEGRSLWEFVADDTTREVYRKLLARVRGNRRVLFPYRCDAPAERRFMRMTMTPVENRGVRFDSLTLRTEPRQPQALLDYGLERSQTLVKLCSWCNRIAVAGAWHEVEAAIEPLELFAVPRPPALSHAMCPDCLTRIMADADAALPGTNPPSAYV